MTEPFKGFWRDLPRPIIGLAPMDGVTDWTCRTIMARYGRPDVIFTEFVHARGLLEVPEKLLRCLDYTEVERPIVAQIYGQNPEDFYRATHIICELGFDGVDINMGCPARKVAGRNCGAALIRMPDSAREIIRSVRKAILDWSNGQMLRDIGLSKKLMRGVVQANEQRGESQPLKRRIPYSIKTRIGYDRDIAPSWVEMLLREEPAVISIHGRTLRQMYKGSADWDAIGRAARIIKKTQTLILGNGDITSIEGAADRILSSGVDGVLLGRGAVGNPWIFSFKEQLRNKLLEKNIDSVPEPFITPHRRFSMAIEHTKLLREKGGESAFHSIKKHIANYLSGFRGAAHLRKQAMLTSNFDELLAQLEPLL